MFDLNIFSDIINFAQLCFYFYHFNAVLGISRRFEFIRDLALERLLIKSCVSFVLVIGMYDAASQTRNKGTNTRVTLNF